MKKFLKNLWVNISMAFEIFKSFLLMCLVVIAIFLALGAVVHNVFKIREIYSEDNLGYKNLVNVSGNRMNVYVKGEGERTIVILSNFANPSPILQYKTYTDRLVANNYRVVVIEYFGYGYSLSTKDSRNIGYLAKEINEALTAAEVFGPYTILANGTSGLYGLVYARNYPELVDELVLVDSIYPATINEEDVKAKIADDNFNLRITSFAELTGYARVLSYIKPDMFGIDKMKELGYSKAEISCYRKMIANRFYTKTMRNEYKELANNMEIIKDCKFPEYLNTIQIISSEYEEGKLLKKNVKNYAEDLITNSSIQKVYIVNGEKDNLSLSNPDEVTNLIINNQINNQMTNNEIVNNEMINVEQVNTDINNY